MDNPGIGCASPRLEPPREVVPAPPAAGRKTPPTGPKRRRMDPTMKRATRAPIALILGFATLWSPLDARLARGEDEPSGSEPAKAPPKKAMKKAGGRASKKGSPEAEAEYEKLREEYESQRSLDAYERAPTLMKFGGAPCKKTIEFLTKVYAEEKN